MAKLDPGAAAAKWRQRISNSVQAVKDGVNAVTESPMEKAAQAKDRYVAGVMRAAESGRYEDGLRSVSLATWKKLTADKGAGRIATGAQEAETKMRDFYQQFLPFAAQVSAEVQAMPKGSIEDSEQRMIANMRKLAQFRFRKRQTS